MGNPPRQPPRQHIPRAKGIGRALATIAAIGALAVAGCGQPRTHWRVQVDPAGICGTGIHDPALAKSRSLETTSHELSATLAAPEFWKTHFNSPAAPGPDVLADIQVRPVTITPAGLAECRISFLNGNNAPDETLRDRFARALSSYHEARRHALEVAAITRLKTLATDTASKSDEESVRLYHAILERIATAEADLLRPGPSPTVIITPE